jgi:hypothetical protein
LSAWLRFITQTTPRSSTFSCEVIYPQGCNSLRSHTLPPSMRSSIPRNPGQRQSALSLKSRMRKPSWRTLLSSPVSPPPSSLKKTSMASTPRLRSSATASTSPVSRSLGGPWQESEVLGGGARPRWAGSTPAPPAKGVNLFTQVWEFVAPHAHHSGVGLGARGASKAFLTEVRLLPPEPRQCNGWGGGSNPLSRGIVTLHCLRPRLMPSGMGSTSRGRPTRPGCAVPLDEGRAAPYAASSPAH